VGTYPVHPEVGHTRRWISLADAAAPTRLTKKGVLPLVSEAGWARSAPVRSQTGKTVGMGSRNRSRNIAATCSFMVGVAGFEPAASSSRTVGAILFGVNRARSVPVWASVYDGRSAPRLLYFCAVHPSADHLLGRSVACHTGT
jgi:hypothetical protein